MKKTHQNQTDAENAGLSSASMWKYAVMTLLFIVISCLSLVFVYHAISQRSSFIDLGIFSASVFVKLFALLMAYNLLDGLRFYYILRTLGIQLQYRYVLRMVFINIFVSTITPLATGGGFAQIYFLNKKGVSIGDATAATTIRTALPIAFFIIATPVIFIVDSRFTKVLPFSNPQEVVLAGSLIFLAIAAVALGAVKNPEFAKKGVLWVCKTLKSKKGDKHRSPTKVLREIDSFTKSVKTFTAANKKDVWLSIIFTAVFLAALFMFPVVLLRGLGYDVSAAAIMALQTIITFATYFAPTPGATGVAEGGFSIIFSQFVGKDEIVTVTFVWRFFTVYIGMAIGMVLFYIELLKNRRGNGSKGLQ